MLYTVSIYCQDSNSSWSAFAYKSTPITELLANGFTLVNSLGVFVETADSSSVSEDDEDDVELDSRGSKIS